MKGYKVFNSDWTCRGFQYKVGETYKHEGEIKICRAGFHFCKKLVDCFNYYTFNPKNKVAIVEAIGGVIKEESNYSNSKCVTDEIKIVKELSWHEVLDIINTGEGNTGFNNTGNYNSGYYNTGDHNSGNYNTGNYNSGYYNNGRCNSGIGNLGDYNSGDCNTDNSNRGYWNTGTNNVGNYNTGNYNIGYYNIGDCNLSDRNVGCFCTNDNKHETIKLFNKESDWTLDTWKNSRAYGIIDNYFKLTIWINKYDMTDEEKEHHPDYKVTRGYLKELSYIEAWKNMWNCINDTEKEAFTSLPNFDKDIFKTITGIDIEEDTNDK
jgi:hypothetical protein